ncbi:MFS transporter [Dehalobacter sp. DCM]|uniref:MFS transporter n=1 Tax=Dehalobacter sp. DCM TaxID=2907827 RepID=UPI003081C6B4|nr:MFS transporter [Dehalobacter sp. DCM]
MNNQHQMNVSILSIFFLIMAPALLIPAMQSMSIAFPGVPFSTILLSQTLPCLILIPTAIIAGALAGTIIKYKSLIVAGIVLFIIGGIFPYFLKDFTSILLSRAVFGIGIGMISPMGNALVLKLYRDKAQVSLLGLGNVFMMIGGIVMQLLGGILCAIGWRYTFLVHLVAIVPLFFVLFYLPEPKKDNRRSREKVRLPKAVYGYTLLFGVVVMLDYTMVLNISSIIADRQLGTPAVAGFVLAMITFGGMMAGMAFSKVYQFVSRFTIALGILLVAAGVGIADFSGNIILLTLGAILTGMGFTTILPAITIEIGIIAPPAVVGIASGILTALLNGGMFFSPFFVNIVQSVTKQNNVWFPILIAAILLAVGGIFFILFQLRKQGTVKEIHNLMKE